MRTETPPAIKLADYAPYPFEIDRVALHFALDPDATIVQTKMQITRTGAKDAPLRLDGEKLVLKSLSIDGVALPKNAYRLEKNALILSDVPDAFTLETEVEIAPSKNTALSGLYISAGRFCTQCEATGFRRITFYPDRPDVMSRFEVTLNADKAAYPILLSNGTPGETGALGDGRHFAVWDDPHKKPAYLFALCAGDYDVLRDSFTTMSGRAVQLGIYVDKGEAARAAWAMDSLKRSMKWDEETYGREYDLGVFNIVAVRDFNFGAMENKGLNIFNSAYVLADEASATDADFEAIESIVAHEYFHNWSGNRVTCRDWFQLCLKEGLTVFRDQNFSADMRSRSVQRIKDVVRLRMRQFPEDDGPLAHSVRPDIYASIDNLYTATVYEKGAEIIGMLKRMIGEDLYRKGMDLYFDRHDGQAVTIEDFYACFESVTGRDFSQMLLWYSQAGTPQVGVQESWDEETGQFTLNLTQHTPDTPQQTGKKPVPIPLSMALLDGEGGHVETAEHGNTEWLEVLDSEMTTITLTCAAGTSRPILSINRGFSAPIRLVRDLDQDTHLALAAAETDPFNQWDALQSLTRAQIMSLSRDEIAQPDAKLVEAMAKAILKASGSDPAYAALLAGLPSVQELFLEGHPARPAALHKARKRLQAALYTALASHVNTVLGAPSPAPFNPNAEQAGVRALRTAMIALQAASPHRDAIHALYALYEKAPNMTEQLALLRALCALKGGPRDAAIAQFYEQWKDNPLVIDKWFAAQAVTGKPSDIEALAGHADFDLSNPNRVRALIGVFAMQNLANFHAADGSGYAAVEELILQADKANPALSARLLSAFEHWRRLEPEARSKAEATLTRLQAAGLSGNASDIVTRTLADQ